MKKNIWLIVFSCILVAELVGIQMNNQSIQIFCKPLLIPILAGYFLTHLRNQHNGLIKWILMALFFSWAGDILLMFQENESIFFLLGLSAFLIAHIFYIIFFHSVRIKEMIKANPWFLVLVVIYYGALIYLLSPYLGNMKMPVRIYGIVISFMFMLAMHMLSIKNKAAGKRMMTGASLFVISDSLLAINKFYQSFEISGILIMATYGLAQFFIVDGARRYIESSNSN